jgi:hypothetical protein
VSIGAAGDRPGRRLGIHLVGDGDVVGERADLGEDRLDPTTLTDRGVREEDQLGHALDSGLTPDGLTEALAGIVERLEHLDVTLGAFERIEVDHGAEQVRVDIDRRDGEQLEPLVADVIELLGQDLPQQLVQPGGTRVLTGLASTHHASTSSQSRPTSTTSTSGNDQTNRSTESISSAVWVAEPETATNASSARPWDSVRPVSEAATWKRRRAPSRMEVTTDRFSFRVWASTIRRSTVRAST